METKRILVIEDNQKHLADAKAFFANKPEYCVEYMTTAGAAADLVKKYWRVKRKDESAVFQYDGIITDLFMPWMSESFTEVVPCGFGIAMLCELARVPYIVNTAGGSHGDKSRWAVYCFEYMDFTDNESRIVTAGAYDEDAETKKWSEALEKLVKKMDKPKS